MNNCFLQAKYLYSVVQKNVIPNLQSRKLKNIMKIGVNTTLPNKGFY